MHPGRSLAQLPLVLSGAVLLIAGCRDRAIEAPSTLDMALPDLPQVVDLLPAPDLPPSSLLPPPRPDGLFDDWQGLPLLASDVAGDASGAFDVTRVQAQSRGAVLFLRFDTGSTLNLQAGATEDGTLRIVLDLPGSRRLTIDLRNRRISLSGQTLFWNDLGYRAAPTYASNDFEVRVDLAPWGVGPGSTIGVNFSGSDALATTAWFTLTDPPLAPPARSPARLPDTQLRVAALNTLESGLLDVDRSAALGRLLRAVAADVYCFEEEYTSDATGIAAALTALDPTGDGRSWQAHKSRDIALASRYRVIPVPTTDLRHTAAVVELPSGPVLIIGVHLSCCGYDGSSEDQQRLAEVQAIGRTVAAFRGAQLGAALAPYRDAPVVVLGDYNLVGSRAPLDALGDPAGPGLEPWLLVHLGAEEVDTWRVRRSSFAPGRLDLVAHSPGALVRRNGYVLDAEELSVAERAALGLQPTDSRATDHLMLVADFAMAPR